MESDAENTGNAGKPNQPSLTPLDVNDCMCKRKQAIFLRLTLNRCGMESLEGRILDHSMSICNLNTSCPGRYDLSHGFTSMSQKLIGFKDCKIQQLKCTGHCQDPEGRCDDNILGGDFLSSDQLCVC